MSAEGGGERPDAPPRSVRPAAGLLAETGRLLVQTCKDFLADGGPDRAAAIAYYGLLSIFPLLLAAISLAAFFVEPTWAIDETARTLGAFVPEGNQLLRETVTGVIHGRGAAGLVSICTLLWAGCRVFGGLTRALNVAYDAEDTRGAAGKLLHELGMTLTLGVLVVLALVSGLGFDLALRLLGERELLRSTVREAAPVLLMAASLYLLYRFVPRRRQDRRAAFTGAAAATLLFVIARPFFGAYVRQFAGWNLIYGSLAIVIGLVVWAWVLALITLFGGELASHVQMMVIEGQTAHQVEQRHRAEGRRQKAEG